MKTKPFNENPSTSASHAAVVWDVVPHGRDVHELLTAGRANTSGTNTTFDLNAPVLARLSHAQVDGPSPAAGVIRLTFDHSGFHIKVSCPFCGANHHHGGGSHVLPNFGHRVADCGGGSYFLIVGTRP